MWHPLYIPCVRACVLPYIWWLSRTSTHPNSGRASLRAMSLPLKASLHFLVPGSYLASFPILLLLLCVSRLRCVLSTPLFLDLLVADAVDDMFETAVRRYRARPCHFSTCFLVSIESLILFAIGESFRLGPVRRQLETAVRRNRMRSCLYPVRFLVLLWD